MFILKRNRKRDRESFNNELKRKGNLDFKGEVEVIGYKNGKKIHEDFGENTVTVFAKHMTMHLLTGENFSSHGYQRAFTGHSSTGVGEGTNPDGTLLSAQQYFSDNSSPDFDINSKWSKIAFDGDTTLGDSSNGADVLKHPFFPTKMLFGTGFEFANWAQIGSSYPDYQTVYEDQGWDETTFNNQISEGNNFYSNVWGGTALTPTRTMNDIFSGALTTPTITDTDFGIPGAIKNGGYSDSSLNRYDIGTGTIKTYYEGGNEFLTKTYSGVGNPAFIYARRESRYFESGSEIQLSSDSYLENKITFTVVLPEQTGANAGIFYPYNGYTLKVAGLFSDAKMLLLNTVPSGTGDDHTDEYSNFLKMPGGIMNAKRYIAPILKTHDISISIRWSIYL